MARQIPLTECHFSYTRSSGPGGQNVNKVNSKVVLKWSPVNSSILSEVEEIRVREKLAGKLTKKNELVITSDTHRDQERNQEECLEKLHALVTQALHVPKKRKPPRKNRGATEKRLQAKRVRATNKKQRQGKGDW